MNRVKSIIIQQQEHSKSKSTTIEATKDASSLGLGACGRFRDSAEAWRGARCKTCRHLNTQPTPNAGPQNNPLWPHSKACQGIERGRLAGILRPALGDSGPVHAGRARTHNPKPRRAPAHSSPALRPSAFHAAAHIDCTKQREAPALGATPHSGGGGGGRKVWWRRVAIDRPPSHRLRSSVSASHPTAHSLWRRPRSFVPSPHPTPTRHRI